MVTGGMKLEHLLLCDDARSAALVCARFGELTEGRA
jgi:hypothetical protein